MEPTDRRLRPTDMDIDTELRVIAAIRHLAHTLGMPGGGMDRVDELLDQRLQDQG